MTFTKKVHELIESCNENEDQTVNLAREKTEMRRQIKSMSERMNKINHCMTELEQKRSDPPSQAPSFTEIARTTSYAPNVVYTPSSPSSDERIDKLEDKASEVERERKLLQIKVAHPGISTSSHDILDLHVEQFLYKQLDMPIRKIYYQLNVAKLPQPNTVMITLSYRRFKVFLFQAKKELRINNAEVYRDLFIK